MLQVLIFFHPVRSESSVTWKLLVRLPDSKPFLKDYLLLFMAQLQLEINGYKSVIVGNCSGAAFFSLVFFFLLSVVGEFQPRKLSWGAEI